MVDDQKGQKNRRELRSVVEEFQGTLLKIRKDYRAAMITSKRTIDTSSMSNRAELFTTTAMKDNRDVNEKVTEDAVMKANNDVTESLQRTLGLMQNELERSVLASQMLGASTKTMRDASSTHDRLTSAMDTSKQLITALQKADWLDRLNIFFGLGFFFLVTLFILKERLVDRSVRIAFWWTKYLPSGKPPIPVATFSNSVTSSETATVASIVLATVTASITSIASVITSTPVGSSTLSTSVDSPVAETSIVSSSSTLGSIISEFLAEPSGFSDGVEPLVASEAETQSVVSITSDARDEL